MEKPKDIQKQVQGIKLFGKTIVLNVKQEPTTSANQKSDDNDQPPSLDKRPEKIIPCPRCKSRDTKFCYFNNYNVNQPRHFCKGCQRYWTAGGALRNVPVGAGRRKAKPPGSTPEFSDSCVFDAHHLELVDGVVLDLAHHCGGGGGGLLYHDFPAKRKRLN